MEDKKQNTKKIIAKAVKKTKTFVNNRIKQTKWIKPGDMVQITHMRDDLKIPTSLNINDEGLLKALRENRREVKKIIWEKPKIKIRGNLEDRLAEKTYIGSFEIGDREYKMIILRNEIFKLN